MELVKIHDASEGIARLQQRLITELQAGHRVLWLIPGGSNIPFAVEIMDAIDESLTKNLLITLTDERYGDYGHDDSNWQQLLDVDFDPKLATVVTVLGQRKSTLEHTTQQFSRRLSELFKQADVVVGQFGMGADGHIAGILPQTVAAHSKALCIGYETDRFARITMGFSAIRHCDVAYVFAFGREKRAALTALTTEQPLATQPAQVLKDLSESYVFNDQQGDAE